MLAVSATPQRFMMLLMIDGQTAKAPYPKDKETCFCLVLFFSQSGLHRLLPLFASYSISLASTRKHIRLPFHPIFVGVLICTVPKISLRDSSVLTFRTPCHMEQSRPTFNMNVILALERLDEYQGGVTQEIVGHNKQSYSSFAF